LTVRVWGWAMGTSQVAFKGQIGRRWRLAFGSHLGEATCGELSAASVGCHVEAPPGGVRSRL
jgi:hypothetical protein